MIKYNVISNARNARGENKTINMKRIFAIFSVIFCLGAVVPNDGWCDRGGYGKGNCILHECKVDEDPSELLSQTGKTQKSGLSNSMDLLGQRCFHCDAINDDDDCRFNDIVATVNGTDISVFVCDDDAGTDDTWQQLHPDLNTLPACASSQLLADARGTVGVAEPVFGNDDARITQSKRLSTSSNRWGDQSKFCVFLECQPHYIPASDKKSCISENVERECRNSHGQWNNNTCTCDSSLGLVNTDPNVPSSPCKCETAGHEWNGSRCADPNEAAIQVCKDSGGDWDSTADPKCKCDKGKGLDGPNSEGKCFCSNSAQVYDSENKVCTDAPETVCKNTGGRWDDTEEKCNCNITNKNIKEKEDSKPTRCECKSEDYDWIGGTESEKGCDLTPEAKKRKTDFEDLNKDCVAWKGNWSPKTWESPDGVDPDKWECKCPSVPGVVQANNVSCKCDTINGYQQTVPNTCTQTTCADLKTKCDKLSDATYKTLTAHGGQEYCECVCNDSNKAYIYSTNKCEAITNICDLIDGAIRDRNGKCICLSNLNPPVKGKCPSGTNSGSASGGGASSSGSPDPMKITQAKEKVSNAYNALEKIEFEKSHWKTASGNFNGARLASDSIAGVVLGTVGGVVTSNVIKKNQVKGGFEKLQCTVGGQMVADFGDQFQVGIR